MKNKVLASWEENANEWIKIVDSKGIASRKFTNNAIVRLLSELPVLKILDCGCGEGWLTRSMTENGKIAVGVDATSTLIEKARKKGPENFYLLSYEGIIAGKSIPGSPFEAIAFNFCLYSKDGIIDLMKTIKKLISGNGFIVIQTLHPFFLNDRKLEYKSQWIDDSWQGIPGNFTNGHSWHARTFGDWVSVFAASGLQLQELIEVTNSEKVPISAIFVLKQSL